MKNIMLILWLINCSSFFGQTIPLNTEKSNDFSSLITKNFKDFQVNDFKLVENTVLDFQLNSDIPFGYETVLMEDELINLFDPEKFKCDCDEKVIKNLKKVVASKKSKDLPEKLGFIPDVVKNRIGNSPAVKLSGLGSKILASGFNYSYSREGKIVSNSGTVEDSPIIENFNIESYLEYGASNFLYTLDCSGYLSAALNADIGVSANSIETSAKGALKNNNSLIIVSGIMYSPLYQGYRGIGIFAEKSQEILTHRKNLINQILKKVPNYAYYDETKVILDTDYKIIITSNKGDSSFNGEAVLSGKANAGFGFGSFSAKGASGGKIERKSIFSDFDCYVIKKNNLNQPDELTIKDLKNKVDEIESELKKIASAN